MIDNNRSSRRISSARASKDDMDEPRPQFEALLEPHRDLLRGYVYRLVGHPADAEDLIQEITVKAFERLESLRSTGAFRSWLFRIATSTCLDHLRKQARWRPYSQSYAEHECAESPELRAEVNATLTDPDFEYDAREHMAFCFTCVGRSLEPPQQAAIVLREILGFSNQEAADTLGVSESVLRHHLSAGRRSMEETYEGLCALVNKRGICRQCAGFRNNTPGPRRGPQLPVLENAASPWQARLDVVRGTHFADGVATSLHELIFERIRKLEGRSK